MSDKPIVFVSGRMNPPTPGHMLILEKAIEEGNKMGANIKIYLTSTHNNLIGKYGKNNKYINPIKPIKGFKEDNEGKKNGYVEVKHKEYQNPLTPEQKKDFVEFMLKNKFSPDELKHVEIFIDHSEKDCNGVLRARSCALAEQNDPNKVFFVMGRETVETERENREKYCGTMESINDSKNLIGEKKIKPYEQKVNCILIERTEGDSENKFSSMSGSLIRRYAILGKMQQLYDVYKGLLSEEQVNELVGLIKFGVNYQDSLSSSPEKSTSPKSPKTRRSSSSSEKSTSPKTKKRRSSSSSSSSSSSKRPKNGGTKKKRVKRKSKRVKY